MIILAIFTGYIICVLVCIYSVRLTIKKRKDKKLRVTVEDKRKSKTTGSEVIYLCVNGISYFDVYNVIIQ